MHPFPVLSQNSAPCSGVIAPPGDETESVQGDISAAARLALLLLRLYTLLLSPLVGGACRFIPSCSEYARVAIVRYGVTRGVWLAARRLSRCHPLGGFGYDPVPGATAVEGHEGSCERPLISTSR